MGRSSKDKSDREHLLGVVRSLRSENKHLKKQLARADKGFKKAVEASSPEEPPLPEPVEVQDIPKCSKCGKKVNIVDLTTRIVYNCINDSCNYRRTVKK